MFLRLLADCCGSYKPCLIWKVKSKKQNLRNQNINFSHYRHQKLWVRPAGPFSRLSRKGAGRPWRVRGAFPRLFAASASSSGAIARGLVVRRRGGSAADHRGLDLNQARHTGVPLCLSPLLSQSHGWPQFPHLCRAGLEWRSFLLRGDHGRLGFPTGGLDSSDHMTEDCQPPASGVGPGCAPGQAAGCVGKR